MKKTFNILSAAAMAILTIGQVSAQSNLGADCGCPPVSARTTVNISTLLNANDEFTATNQVFTCDKIYILDRKAYVDSTKTLTIQPGTIIKGGPSPTGQPADATALIVERGAKIFAQGTASCPIVFTASADPMDGTYSYTNRGQWGGVVILGNATNNHNLTTSTAAFGGTCTGSGCNGTGIGKGYIEGFNAADARNQYGGGTTPNDDDNSGIMTYVSIRHAGAILAVGNELNGLSLGSVGRGTKLENIEIVSCDDDAIEFFGGTVNLKYASVLYSNDDMFDWDNGYSGKMQFLFGVQADSTVTTTADNGFEADSDDKKSGAYPKANPIIYNATLMSNGKYLLTSDNSAHAAMNMKELTSGQIYNSVFAGFKHGINFQQSVGTRNAAQGEAYALWKDSTSANQIKINCNTFTGTKTWMVVNANNAGAFTLASAADSAKLTADNNSFVTSIPGFDYQFTLTGNTVTNRYDAVPTPNLTTGCPTSTDAFFTPAAYQGAFSNNQRTWLSDWAYSLALQSEQSFGGCPTDIDGNGITNNADFLILLGKFNQSCN